MRVVDNFRALYGADGLFCVAFKVAVRTKIAVVGTNLPLPFAQQGGTGSFVATAHLTDGDATLSTGVHRLTEDNDDKQNKTV
jgi:hypothetical protein